MSNPSVRLGEKRPRHTGAFTDAVTSDRRCTRFRLIPLRVELGPGLTRSAPLGLEKSVHLESDLALEHQIDSPAELMRQKAQGFALIMLFLKAAHQLLPLRVMAQEGGGFGKGPFEVRIADFLA